MTMPDREDQQGIPQIVSVEEMTAPLAKPVPASPNPDVIALAAAITSVIEYSRPEKIDPINFIGGLTASTKTTYQKLVEWIPDAPGGILKEISITSDPNALYKLVIADKEVFKDTTLVASLTFDYDRMRLGGGSGKSTAVYAKSASGVAVTLQAIINGEQILK